MRPYCVRSNVSNVVLIGASGFIKGYLLISKFILSLLLCLARKSSTRKSKKYSDQKLAELNFKKLCNLEPGMGAFAAWCKIFYSNQSVRHVI